MLLVVKGKHENMNPRNTQESQLHYMHYIMRCKPNLYCRVPTINQIANKHTSISKIWWLQSHKRNISQSMVKEAQICILQEVTEPITVLDLNLENHNTIRPPFSTTTTCLQNKLSRKEKHSRRQPMRNSSEILKGLMRTELWTYPLFETSQNALNVQLEISLLKLCDLKMHSQWLNPFLFQCEDERLCTPIYSTSLNNSKENTQK